MASSVFNVNTMDLGYKVIKSSADPLPSNYNYEIGTLWVNTDLNKTFVLTDNTVGAATWVQTNNVSGGDGYITVIDDNYTETNWGTTFDSTTAKNSIWYIGISSNDSSSSMSFEVNVTNDETNQDFSVSSTGYIADADVRVTFPSSGNAHLEVVIPASTGAWTIVSKRLDIE